jgi:hypothetical protein
MRHGPNVAASLQAGSGRRRADPPRVSQNQRKHDIEMGMNLKKRLLLSGAAVGVGILIVTAGVSAQTPSAPLTPAPTAAAPAAVNVDCSVNPDPYKNYTCLDAYLGANVAGRLYNYYKLEMGQAAAPSDPTAPPGRRADWPTTPETTPPMPFTEWPYGGTTNLGVNRPASVDSPLMVAIANTGIGKFLSDYNIQIYGWIDPGANLSTNSQRPAGNSPIGYAYTPNTVQLDQAVLYIERTPDTVQTDHIDWGFRLSGIYGENYRYTTSYGLGSSQLLKHNNVNGYDFPMVYGEIFIPQVFQGLMIRAGRYISLPDIEAQLAPNNYMYTHSLTYTFDNYTNTGIQTTLAVTKDLLLQFGVSDGTETAFWHDSAREPNLDPYNALYPTASFPKDPGNQPSFTACARYSWDDEHYNIQPCANGINRGNWGYNNLQWYGATFYHKFNDQWHISVESYYEFQNGVPNANNPQVQQIYGAGGTPFSPEFLTYNAPNLAQCKNSTLLRCRASAVGAIAYLNYSPDPLNNFSLRPEFYHDPQGQRTGVAANYWEITLGWQHWLSPQIEFRPEIGYWAANKNVFNGSPSKGIAPDKNHAFVAASDVIFHF